MLLFRVAKETPRADFPLGPYAQADLIPDYWDWKHWDAAHPTPDQEGLRWVTNDGGVCGTTSFRALKAWFAGCWDGLKTAGFSLYVYRVPSEAVQVGRLQAVFDPSRATLVKAVPLDRFSSL